MAYFVPSRPAAELCGAAFARHVGRAYTTVKNGGPRDRRPVERRDDVLVYSTPPLDQDVEATGPVELVLCAASSAIETDFTATLVDVHPNGLAIVVCEGILRTRFRASLEDPSPIEPGRVYTYQVSLWETSNVFRAGHRIRLEVSSSNFRASTAT